MKAYAIKTDRVGFRDGWLTVDVPIQGECWVSSQLHGEFTFATREDAERAVPGADCDVVAVETDADGFWVEAA